ncbi:MAG: TIR domain-containing protein [Crocinitomicaceae bacterium]|nr:TIR domain-containing protein [Crocinitomicaceae bacterium]MBK8925024.1 TIR domain-containing protein [Crocinitomicaceae bacterium]
MANKIFVSYKHSDRQVLQISGCYPTTARDYVDKIEKMIEAGDHIYKGENDNEDIGSLADATIGSKLGDKIFDSSVTIVLISKGMKEYYISEKEQWIPWEISYSLKEQSRFGGKSKTNAILAVVLPDENGSYDYFLEYNSACNSTTYKTDTLFQILRDNMFNLIDREANSSICNGSKIYSGYFSYIHSVKWENFVGKLNFYVEIALDIRKNISKYEIVKTVK